MTLTSPMCGIIKKKTWYDNSHCKTNNIMIHTCILHNYNNEKIMYIYFFMLQQKTAGSLNLFQTPQLPAQAHYIIHLVLSVVSKDILLVDQREYHV